MYEIVVASVQPLSDIICEWTLLLLQVFVDYVLDPILAFAKETGSYLSQHGAWILSYTVLAIHGPGVILIALQCIRTCVDIFLGLRSLFTTRKHGQEAT